MATIYDESIRNSSRPALASISTLSGSSMNSQCRFHRRVIHLAVRWMLDQGISVALWGGRHPDQVEAALDVAGWSLNTADRELIERIVNATIKDPIGPEFMAPLQRS